MMPERVGFVGLGIMGKPMATNLMDAGYKLTVHNRSPEKANELGEAGATVAKSPKEVAENTDIIITMLPARWKYERSSPAKTDSCRTHVRAPS
jgi:2-hydroxy-3-oxopropionate reductase